MQSMKEQIVAVVDELDDSDIVSTLDGYDDELFWWLDDAYPGSTLTGELADSIALMHAKLKNPQDFSAALAEFIMSDVTLQESVASAYGLDGV